MVCHCSDEQCRTAKLCLALSSEQWHIVVRNPGRRDGIGRPYSVRGNGWRRRRHWAAASGPWERPTGRGKCPATTAPRSPVQATGSAATGGASAHRAAPMLLPHPFADDLYAAGRRMLWQPVPRRRPLQIVQPSLGGDHRRIGLQCQRKVLHRRLASAPSCSTGSPGCSRPPPRRAPAWRCANASRSRP